jgi:hypothetical protein
MSVYGAFAAMVMTFLRRQGAGEGCGMGWDGKGCRTGWEGLGWGPDVVNVSGEEGEGFCWSRCRDEGSG